MVFVTGWLEGGLHFYDGQFAKALQGWKKWYELYPNNPFSRFYYAMILTYNDRQQNEALGWLENEVNHGFINYSFLNEYDPFLENICVEERFKKLMERVKHEQENFKVRELSIPHFYRSAANTLWK